MAQLAARERSPSPASVKRSSEEPRQIRAYDRLAGGVPAPQVLKEAHAWFGDIEFGCILLGADSHAAGSNRDMAWTFREGL